MIYLSRILYTENTILSEGSNTTIFAIIEYLLITDLKMVHSLISVEHLNNLQISRTYLKL
jgi:hypothetical protein